MYMAEDKEPKVKFAHIRIKPYLQFIVDIFVFGLVVGSLITLSSYYKPVERGFFCNDNSLKYPKLPSTVPSFHLLTAAIGIPFVVIAVMELIHKIRVLGFYGSLVGFLKYFGFCMFGLFSMLVIQDLARKVTGGLRPHFWTVCQPSFDTSLCTTGEYITEFMCISNASVGSIEDTRVSTPSGHTAISFYIALWLCVYIHFRMRNPFSKFLKMSAQCALIAAAYWVALTRVKDFYHRMEDIFAGIIMGVAAAIWTVLASKEHLDYNTKILMVEKTKSKISLPSRVMHYDPQRHPESTHTE